MRLIQVLLFCIIVTQAITLKILVFSPKFGYSHVMFAGTIADLLTKAGHRNPKANLPKIVFCYSVVQKIKLPKQFSCYCYCNQ
uniref:Glucuronosyltransferase n=1 Tax=Syphacia muris TaxID=451379 RepID=A0A0N5ASW2_9BILA